MKRTYQPSNVRRKGPTAFIRMATLGTQGIEKTKGQGTEKLTVRCRRNGLVRKKGGWCREAANFPKQARLRNGQSF
jgi:ribosomal protein L34